MHSCHQGCLQMDHDQSLLVAVHAQPRLLEIATRHQGRPRPTTPPGTASSCWMPSPALWTSGLGHRHPAIVSAVQEQVATLDYCMGFQITNDHPPLPSPARGCGLAPAGLIGVLPVRVRSADTTLKIALAYHRARGDGHRPADRSRARLSRRGTSGTSVGGIPPTVRSSAPCCCPASTISATPTACRTWPSAAASQGWGGELAEDLERASSACTTLPTSPR